MTPYFYLSYWFLYQNNYFVNKMKKRLALKSRMHNNFAPAVSGVHKKAALSA
jgi:hypothetical protein